MENGWRRWNGLTEHLKGHCDVECTVSSSLKDSHQFLCTSRVIVNKTEPLF